MLDIEYEFIECLMQVRFETRGWTRRIGLPVLFVIVVYGRVLAKRPLKRFLVPAKRIGTFLNCKATVVRQDVGVSSRAILSVLDHMRLHIIADSFISAHGRKRSWVLGHISRSRCNLFARLVRDGEPAVVIGNVGIRTVTALVEAFLESVALVDQNGLEVTRTVHLDS